MNRLDAERPGREMFSYGDKIECANSSFNFGFAFPVS